MIFGVAFVIKKRRHLCCSQLERSSARSGVIYVVRENAKTCQHWTGGLGETNFSTTFRRRTDLVHQPYEVLEITP